MNVDVLYNPTRLLPDTDPTGFFTLVGFGSLFENMDLAARELGFRVAVTYSGVSLDATKEGPQPVARATLHRSKEPGRFPARLIRERRTSRLPYKETPIDPKLLDQLRAIASEFGQRFTFTQDPTLVRWLLELNRDTLFYDMADPTARNEVGHWIRYGMRQGRRKRDGLWSHCLGFPGYLLWLFVHARGLFEVPGLRGLSRRLYLQTTRGTHTVGWLSGRLTTREDAIRTGRMLALLWLAMTARGIYLHPFGSIITNEKAHARLAERIRVDESEGQLWLVVRLGHSDEPPRSLRLSLDELLEP